MDVALSFNRSRTEAEAIAAESSPRAGDRTSLRPISATPTSAARWWTARPRHSAGSTSSINMASVYTSVPFDQTDEHVWHAAMDVDLRAAFLCAKAAVPHMRRAGAGRIINFSDWVAASGRPRYPGYLPYYVAKAGAIALTEALALELAADKILVNAIAPGPIVPPPVRPTRKSERWKRRRRSAAGAGPRRSSARSCSCSKRTS